MPYSTSQPTASGRHYLLSILLCAGFLASSISGRAQTRVDSDNFNAAPLSTIWWGPAQTTPGYDANITLGLSLDATPSHLSLTGSGTGVSAAQMQVTRYWDPTQLIYFTWSSPLDFSVTVRAHNAFTPTFDNQYVSVGLTLSAASGGINENLNLYLVQGRGAGGTMVNQVTAYLQGLGESSSTTAAPFSIPLAGSDAMLRIDYTASTQVLDTWFDLGLGDGWQTLGSFGVGGSGGSVATTNWINPNPEILVFGLASNADAGPLSIAEGTVYLDDFSSTATISSIPEPASVAASLGTLALGAAIGVRRWRAASRHTPTSATG